MADFTIKWQHGRFVSNWGHVALLPLTVFACGQAPGAESPLVVGDSDAPHVQFSWSTKSIKKSEIQIFNGTSPKRGNWQSILTAYLVHLPTDNVPNPTCTATFVGPGVLLTAAHCVMRGAQVKPSSIELKIDSYSLTFTCAVDKAYANQPPVVDPRSGADYALCSMKVNEARPPSIAHIQPDWINVTPMSGNVTLLAAGYGCTSWAWNSNTDRYDPGAVSPILTVGDVSVTVSDPERALIASTSDGASQPAVCGGDSGGPAYSGVSASALDVSRDIRAVASTIDYRTATSRFASLGTTEFRNFVACWRGANPNAVVHIRASAFDANVAAKLC